MRWVAAMAIALASCVPEINTGTYFCGPERLCPPELECDDTSFTCVNPLLVDPFTCPEGANLFEPDDSPEDARDLGDLECDPGAVLSTAGCVVGADADYYALAYPSGCGERSSRLTVTLRYPVATMPLTVELLDSQGEVIAVGGLCTPAVDYSGRDWLCIEVEPSAQGYYVRVEGLTDAPDCGGDCDHNSYELDINLLLS
jgi:hypothetical protein